MEPPFIHRIWLQHISIYSIGLVASIILILMLVRPRKWHHRWLCVAVCGFVGLIMPFAAIQIATLSWRLAPEPAPETWLSNAQYNLIFARELWTLAGFSIAGGVVGACTGFASSRSRASS